MVGTASDGSGVQGDIVAPCSAVFSLFAVRTVCGALKANRMRTFASVGRERAAFSLLSLVNKQNLQPIDRSINQNVLEWLKVPVPSL